MDYITPTLLIVLWSGWIMSAVTGRWITIASLLPQLPEPATREDVRRVAASGSLLTMAITVLWLYNPIHGEVFSAVILPLAVVGSLVVSLSNLKVRWVRRNQSSGGKATARG